MGKGAQGAMQARARALRRGEAGLVGAAALLHTPSREHSREQT